MGDAFIRKEGYRYCFDASKCATCGGRCCRGESGYIWVKPEEIEAISKFLGMETEDFAIMHIRKAGHRYSLNEKILGENDHACIFFDEIKQQCGIYEVRPIQCRTFPFWEQFKKNEQEVRDECPGIV
jgi:Fe-S-cluster containining protein